MKLWVIALVASGVVGLLVAAGKVAQNAAAAGSEHMEKEATIWR